MIVDKSLVQFGVFLCLLHHAYVQKNIQIMLSFIWVWQQTLARQVKYIFITYKIPFGNYTFDYSILDSNHILILEINLNGLIYIETVTTQITEDCLQKCCKHCYANRGNILIGICKIILTIGSVKVELFHLQLPRLFLSSLITGTTKSPGSNI